MYLSVVVLKLMANGELPKSTISPLFLYFFLLKQNFVHYPTFAVDDLCFVMEHERSFYMHLIRGLPIKICGLKIFSLRIDCDKFHTCFIIYLCLNPLPNDKF